MGQKKIPRNKGKHWKILQTVKTLERLGKFEEEFWKSLKTLEAQENSMENLLENS